MPCEQTAAYHTSDSVMAVTFADDTAVVRRMTNGDTHPALRQQGEQGVERSLVYRFLGTTVKDSLSWALSIGLMCTDSMNRRGYNKVVLLSRRYQPRPRHYHE